jgi:hypothetical protein
MVTALLVPVVAPVRLQPPMVTALLVPVVAPVRLKPPMVMVTVPVVTAVPSQHPMVMVTVLALLVIVTVVMVTMTFVVTITLGTLQQEPPFDGSGPATMPAGGTVVPVPVQLPLLVVTVLAALQNSSRTERSHPMAASLPATQRTPPPMAGSLPATQRTPPLV